MKAKLRRILLGMFNRVTLAALLLVVELAWLISLVAGLSRHYIWIAPIFTAISFLIIADILRRDNNPAYKMGWILLIAIVPLFGWLTYAVFGNKRMTRRMHQRITSTEQAHRDDLRTAPVSSPLSPIDTDSLPPRFLSTSRYLHDKGGAVPHANTDVTYYSLGDDMFPALLQAIANAKRYIFMEYFIISPGVMLDRLVDALAEKAAMGVDVRILYDDFGVRAPELVDFSKQMEKRGIRALPFNPIVPIFSIVVNHRNHRKITVIDGEIAFTGGINLADEYINQKQRFGHWKDTGLSLRGDAAWSYTIAFLNLWNATHKTDDSYAAFCPSRPYCASAAAPILVQPFFDSPLDDENVGENVYLEILAQAERYVYIFTPYLIIDAEMQVALCNAAKRGVDVRIVTPGIPDKKSVFQLTRSYYSVLLQAGVRIYEYAPGFLHAKSFLCDDRVAVVGTINLDYRSLYLHFECGALFYGGEVLARLHEDYEQTFAKSRQIKSPSFGRARGLIGGLKEAVLRAIAPLM
jgi:cardiolipin synthase